MARLAAFSVLVSSGTMLAAIGMGQVGVTGGALYYMVSSTLGISALFLLVELFERGREPGADVLAVTREAYGEDDDTDEEKEDETGLAMPITMGELGLAFIGCAVVIAGLPPLSGFIAKFALLSAALDPTGIHPGNGSVSMASWALLAILILSGLAAVIALTRAGIRVFWAEFDRAVPRVRLIEMAPIAVLLFLCVMQTALAGPVMQFMETAAHSIHTPADYVRAVLPPAEQAYKAGRT
jgi:multicomponent K+:H+ antiporter subunit D